MPDVDDCNPTEAGERIHEWFEDEFSSYDFLEFENTVEYQDQYGEWQEGQYDAFDGNYVYEFKTKHELPRDDLPLDEDLEQVENYRKGLDADAAILVYLGRDDFNIKEYLVDY